MDKTQADNIIFQEQLLACYVQQEHMALKVNKIARHSKKINMSKQCTNG
jgi:hypothetical protein